MNSPFEMTKDEMTSYGYKIVEQIVNHFTEVEHKKPVNKASRKEMDTIFLSEAPDEATSADDVLDFVMKNSES